MLKAMFSSLSKIFPKQRDVQGSDNSYLSKSDWKDVDIYYEANKIIYNENADALNISDILRNGRLRYANYKLSDLNSLYFFR